MTECVAPDLGGDRSLRHRQNRRIGSTVAGLDELNGDGADRACCLGCR
jgi:hypothetical protein